MPNAPAQSSSKIKLACIAAAEAFSSDRVPTTVPAAAFADTVKLLKQSAIKLLQDQSGGMKWLPLISIIVNTQNIIITIAVRIRMGIRRWCQSLKKGESRRFLEPSA
jgi:hypothetical protein